MRERGFDWLRDAIEEEYQEIVRHGGIAMPAEVPESFGGFQPVPPPKGSGELLPIYDASSPDFNLWRETNVQRQKQPGYSIVTVTVPQGNLDWRPDARAGRSVRASGDGSLRFSMNQNVVLAYVPNGAIKARLWADRRAGLADDGADEISDVVTCPGAYSCNLGLTKTMNLGDELREMLKTETDTLVRNLRINMSGCPNSCGQHWIARHRILRQRAQDRGQGSPLLSDAAGGTYQQFGVAIQSLPAR